MWIPLRSVNVGYHEPSLSAGKPVLQPVVAAQPMMVHGPQRLVVQAATNPSGVS